jgi:hypothetical protein
MLMPKDAAKGIPVFHDAGYGRVRKDIEGFEGMEGYGRIWQDTAVLDPVAISFHLMLLSLDSVATSK